MPLFLASLAFAGNLESFSVTHTECSGVEYGERIDYSWGNDGVLTVTVQKLETATAQARDTGARIYELGERIILVYETYSPFRSGDAVPACLFPVQLTYRISGLPQKDYHFLPIEQQVMNILWVGLAILLGSIGMLMFWWRGRCKRRPNRIASE